MMNVTLKVIGQWFVILMVIGQRFVKLIGCWFIYRLLPRRALKVTTSSKSTPYIPVHICTCYLWCKSANSWIHCYFLITSRVFWSYPSFSHRMISLIPKITRFKFFSTQDYQIWCFLAQQPFLSNLFCCTNKYIRIIHPVLSNRWIQTHSSGRIRLIVLICQMLFYSLPSCWTSMYLHTCMSTLPLVVLENPPMSYSNWYTCNRAC